jgi:5'-methylthioadenosine phosphorylase
MEGPAFSTRAESLTEPPAGYDVIGMTNLGEAKCAREAEIAYATLAMPPTTIAGKGRARHAGNGHRQPPPQRGHMAKKIVARAIPQIPPNRTGRAIPR